MHGSHCNHAHHHRAVPRVADPSVRSLRRLSKSFWQCWPKCHLDTDALLRLSTKVYKHHLANVRRRYLSSDLRRKTNGTFQLANWRTSRLFAFTEVFLMVVDWVMRQSTVDQKKGIQSTFNKQLEDLDFADDISLLSHKKQVAQEKLCCVAEKAEMTGLQLNTGKAEIMRVNNKNQYPVKLHHEKTKEVDKFVYLGSKNGGTYEDIKSRIKKARHVFNSLRQIWKLKVLSTNVKSVLLYGSETWRVTNTITHKLQTFTNQCLKNTLNIRWLEVVSNEELWNKTKQVTLETEIIKRKWGWIDHTLCNPAANITRQALDWNPQRKKKVGRSKQIWQSIEAETKVTGMTWADLKRTS